MAASKEPSFLCEFCGAKVDKYAIKCNTCGHIFDSIKCPSCGFQGKADAFPNGCPKCGYQSSSLEELRDKIINAQGDNLSERKIAVSGSRKKGGRTNANPPSKATRYLTAALNSMTKKKKPKNRPWFSKGTYILISVGLLLLILAMAGALYFLLLLE